MASLASRLVCIARFFQLVDVGFEICVGTHTAVLVCHVVVLQVRLTICYSLPIVRSDGLDLSVLRSTIFHFQVAMIDRWLVI